MNIDIVFSGFGGQGILFISKILSYAALESGLNVTWFPSYGPEMRGGTANCSVVISDREISSPIISNPRYMIVMNYPSLNKYENKVIDGGSILINSDIVKRNNSRKGIKYFDVPVQSIAKSISQKVFGNIVMLGFLTRVINVVSINSVIECLKKNLNKKFNFVDNERALRAGYKFLEVFK